MIYPFVSSAFLVHSVDCSQESSQSLLNILDPNIAYYCQAVTEYVYQAIVGLSIHIHINNIFKVCSNFLYF